MGELPRRQIEPSLHEFDHSKITNPWSEGATEEGKIRDDGFVQINLAVLMVDESKMRGCKVDGSKSHVTSTWFE